MNKGQLWLVILAAGRSTRMGSPKQLLPVQGNSMLRHAVNTALASGEKHVAVVAAEDGRVTPELTLGLPVLWILNAHPEEGLSSSIRAAVKTLMQEHQPEAVMFLLADQPELGSDVIAAVASAYRTMRPPIVQAQYRDRPGHPVVFDSSMFQQLLQIQGDQGAREVISRNRDGMQWVEVNSEMPQDVDTPEEYEACMKRMNAHE